MMTVAAVRKAILGLLLAVAAGAQAQTPADGGGDFRVTLLGTGSPAPLVNRSGPATLVQVGGQTLLFDCGRGATQRLWQLKVPLGEADKLFLTHLHSDHVVGIPDLWLTGWLQTAYAGRKGAFTVYGPAGTKGLMENLRKAYDWDIKTRIADQNLPPEAAAVRVNEFTEGVVYEKDGVRVTAFEVDHGDLIKPAFGFRVDYGGRSVVISGDTKFNENLIRHATGVDLLIHSVAAVREELLQSPIFKVILAHHTKPDEAGVVFARAKPKLAVYYHFVLLGTPKVPPVAEQDVIDMTRKTYAGPFLVGKDLMSFALTGSGVAVTEK
jgi:ribonuclease Z